MSFLPQTLLCHYRYDPLGRLVGHALPHKPAHQRFYCRSRLATEIQGALQHSIVQHEDLLLAQQQRQDNQLDTTLFATDQQRSVLQTLKANHPPRPIAYSPYGHHSTESGLTSLLGFNGERPDPVTGHYLLGNGYRAFNPVLMRFNSPDSLSPFGKGGVNSYAYCLGDPINFYDPNGQFGFRAAAQIVRWRGRAVARVAARANELAQVTKTRSVRVDPSFSDVKFKLKSGIAPQDGIKARDRLIEIDLSSKNRKYTHDLFNEREMASFVEKTGSKMPDEVMDRYHMLEHIKSKNPLSGFTYDLEKLYGEKGPFVEARQAYRAVLAKYRDPLHETFSARANEIRELHFEK